MSFTMQGWSLENIADHMDSLEGSVLVTITPIEIKKSHPIKYYMQFAESVVDSLLDAELIKDVFSIRIARPVIEDQIGVRISIEEISRRIDE